MNTDNNKKESLKYVFFEWIEALITSVVVVVILFTLIFRVVNVSGASMEKTIYDGDKVILTNFMYTPTNTDIVVIAKAQHFSEPIIKRVIAVEGQVIDINFATGDVKVDGKIINESSYIKNATTSNEGVNFPVTVPEGHVFVMGDNRMNSKDSRSPQIGLIDVRDIVGKAQLIVFPFNRFGGLS